MTQGWSDVWHMLDMILMQVAGYSMVHTVMNHGSLMQAWRVEVSCSRYRSSRMMAWQDGHVMFLWPDAGTEYDVAAGFVMLGIGEHVLQAWFICLDIASLLLLTRYVQVMLLVLVGASDDKVMIHALMSHGI